jgi:hypothetical protein
MKCSCPRRLRELRRQILTRLVPLFGLEAVRSTDQGDGPCAPDILAPHVAVTCVRGRKVDVRAALREATLRNRYPDEWSVAACKDDGQPPIIAMRLEDFLSLLEEWHVCRKRPSVRVA